ncbi:MAG: helix-turn-helix transcriptional regulator [Chloroflexi bacterium]|nr:helix-turn-helix transcriptional regulator [Chloroflexota bacterium]
MNAYREHDMIILTTPLPAIDAADAPVSPLNTIWYGVPSQRMTLPQLGHLFIVCPLGETVAACSGTLVDSEHYLLLTPSVGNNAYILDNLRPDDSESRLLLLLLSPAFIAEMAEFLSIPFDMTHLLHAVRLPKGDVISHLLRLMAGTLHDPEQTEELFMEVVGQILRLLRLRHQTLINLAHHKAATVNDLIPCLLQARQYIEAHYLENLQTETVARRAALSEYHFARLFKTAFDITVHQYVLRLRLNRARHLLELSTMSITDIALTVGYSSLSAFIHAFRHYTGITPSDYRAQFR